MSPFEAENCSASFLSANFMNKIVAQEVILNARLGLFHYKLLVITTLAVAFAGNNLLSYSVALPILIHDWGLTTLQAGLLGSYALVGMMIGDFSFGYISRVLGSKNTIAFCLFVLGVASLIQGTVTGYEEFAALRVLSGLAIGGLMPSIISTMSEYSPRKQKNVLTAIMVSGYSFGGIVASVIGLSLSEKYGWRVLFYAGGAQLLIIPFVLSIVPADINSLIHSGDLDAVNTLLKNANGEYKPDINSVVISRHQKHDQHSALELFSQRRRFATLIFWIIFFGCLFVAYSIINWLPKIMLTRGFAVDSSILFFVMLNVGAIIGGVLGGILGDKFSTDKVLTLFFVVCAFCLVLISQVESKGALYILVIALGGTTIGAQTLVYILIAHNHAAPLRSTAIAYASGVGRIGAISGPVVGGILIGGYLTVGAYLVLISICTLLAALATTLVPKPEAEH